MSWAAPSLRWDALRPDPVGGRPAVQVDAELSALGDRERALLEARLAGRLELHAVLVGRGERPVVAFLGCDAAHVTAAFRRTAEHALRTVSADVAAGWTAEDERERDRPFAWGDRPATTAVARPTVEDHEAVPRAPAAGLAPDVRGAA